MSAEDERGLERGAPSPVVVIGSHQSGEDGDSPAGDEPHTPSAKPGIGFSAKRCVQRCSHARRALSPFQAGDADAQERACASVPMQSHKKGAR